MSNKLPLVVVEWLDAWTRGDHPVTLADVGAIHHPEPVTTIGWALQNDDSGITLANEYYADGYRGLTFIPAGMIISVTPYNLTRQRTPKARNAPATPPPGSDIT